MQFAQLQWTFPIAVALHNSEEAISMPGWAERHGLHLPFEPPGAAAIRFALLVATLAAFVVTYLSARRGKQSLWAYLTFGYIIAMLVNVFVPHFPAAVMFRSYVPGLVTAVLVNLPVMGWLAARAVRDGWVGGWKAVAFGAAVPVLLGAVIVAAFETRLLG